MYCQINYIKTFTEYLNPLVSKVHVQCWLVTHVRYIFGICDGILVRVFSVALEMLLLVCITSLMKKLEWNNELLTINA